MLTNQMMGVSWLLWAVLWVFAGRLQHFAVAESQVLPPDASKNQHLKPTSGLPTLIASDAVKDKEPREEASSELLGQCRKDPDLARMCLTCAALPKVLALPVSLCCSEETARLLCELCVEDPVSCLEELANIQEQLMDGYDVLGGGNDDVVIGGDHFPLDRQADWEVEGQFKSKRYGTLFLGKRPLHFLSRTNDVHTDVMKREGHDYNDFTGYDDADDVDGNVMFDKRWGSLGIGNGKRWGTLSLGKRWGALGIGKRWGTLGIGNGKSWGTLGIGKRGNIPWRVNDDDFVDFPSNYDPYSNGDEEADEGKRWGSLGLSNGRGWGVAKRWGSLGLGFGRRPGSLGVSRGGHHVDKRWGSLGLSKWRKRWGQLGLGHYRGKRQEHLADLDRVLYPKDDIFYDDDNDEKRWGTLGLGRSGWGVHRLRDKRWGSLGMGGNRWGARDFGNSDVRQSIPSLWFRTRRSLPQIEGNGLGHDTQPLTSSSSSTLSESSAASSSDRGRQKRSVKTAPTSLASDPDLQKRVRLVGDRWQMGFFYKPIAKPHYDVAVTKKWGTLGLGKKRGVLGPENDIFSDGQKRWGTLSLGKKRDGAAQSEEQETDERKRWGTLGLGKKWGTLGLGKKWGTLGFGKKRDNFEGGDDEQKLDEKKRWGTLSLGKKRADAADSSLADDLTQGGEKLWGTLGLGQK